MGTSFLVSVKSLVRTPSVIVWVLAFPLIMSAIFLFMFSGMRTDGVVDPVPVALVAPADEKDGAPAGSFAQVVDVLAEPGEDQLLDLRHVETAADAADLLAAGEVDGYFELAPDGTPALTVGSAYTLASADGATAVNRTILETVASSYVQSRALLEEVAQRDSAALADPASVTDALGIQVAVERVQITHARPEEIVRYYYALLGMGALMASQAGMLAVAQAQPGVSALGARRAVSGTSRLRQLAGCVLGAWAVSTVALTLAFAFLRLVVGVDFGGREGLALVSVAVCALLATALGACVGALPLSAGISATFGYPHGADLRALALCRPLRNCGDGARGQPRPHAAVDELGEPGQARVRHVLRALLLHLARAVCRAPRRLRGGRARPSRRGRRHL